METWLEQLLSSVTATPWYYLLVAAIATAEGVVLIGLVVPGSVLCVTIGALAAAGHGDFALSCVCAAIGALLGDLISYFLGGRFGPRLTQSVFPQRSKPLLKRARIFFSAHGGKSLFLARFLGPLRGLVPFVAGSVQYPPKAFLGYSSLAAALWGISYPGLGYLGLKSWQQVSFLHSLEGLSILGVFLLILLITGRYLRDQKRH